MINVLNHRGPDDSQTWKNSFLSFGIARLSIIDPKLGMQPIWYEGLGIVFNGEIYNYKSLRRNLKKLGYSFKTNSDTEVFLKLFHHYGYKAFSMINGMFGVCIIDLKKKKIVICRDRIGKKPLYYYKKRFIYIQ